MIVYFYFFVLPLLLPMVLGMIILIAFWKDKPSRAMGFFVLKPVLAYPVWFFLSQFLFSFGNYSRFDMIYILKVISSLSPGILLTLGIVYAFRSLLDQQLIQLFLGLDILRMLNTFVLANSNNNQFFVWFGLLLPSAIAVFALVVAIIRHRQTVTLR